MNVNLFIHSFINFNFCYELFRNIAIVLRFYWWVFMDEIFESNLAELSKKNES